MKTPALTEKNEDSHINPGAAQSPPAANAPASVSKSTHPPIHPSTRPSGSPAATLLPTSALDRQFRAASFASKLNEAQRSTLSLWLGNADLSIDSIRKKIAAPPPEGFGLEVQPTTLRRLRALVKNCEVTGWFSDSMDTACDLLADPDTAEVAPLREALRLMLYSRAIYAAKNQADPSAIDKLVTTINKLEKPKTGSRLGPPSVDSLVAPERSNAPLTTRHHVELTVRTAPAESAPRILDCTATTPASATAPASSSGRPELPPETKTFSATRFNATILPTNG
jgi:hypothetical protein